MCIAVAVTKGGLLHYPYLIKENFNDENFKEELAPTLKKGIVVFGDLLGKSGRKKEPTAQHFNPQTKKIIEEKGCKFAFLLPYGKFLNPCELVNSFLKGEVPKMYVGSITSSICRSC